MTGYPLSLNGGRCCYTSIYKYTTTKIEIHQNGTYYSILLKMAKLIYDFLDYFQNYGKILASIQS